MKKYLLTFLLWLFAFVGFTNAELITFEWNQNTKVYTPNTITFWEDINITYDNYTDYISNISCNAMACHISIWNCNIAGSADFMRNISNCNLSAWTYQIGYDSLQYSTLFSTITIDNLSSSSGGWTSWEWNWNILDDWFSYLSSWISALSSVIWQIIDYCVFMTVSLLVAFLWFTAIKWLMWYMYNLVKKPFNKK